MEEPKAKPKSKRILVLSVLVSTALIIFTVGLVLSSTWFLSADTPEEPETITETREEHCKRLPNDPVCELREPTTNTEFPDTTYTKEPLAITSKIVIPLDEQKPVSVEPVYKNTFEPVVVLEETVINKVKEIPLTVLDMAKFVSTNPTLSDKDVDLLISYVVGKERGLVDTERDLEVEELMEKYLE